jgi:zinc protease
VVRRSSSLGFLLAALLFASTAHTEPREVRLANGVRVLLVPDPTAAAVDVATWHPAGSVWETANTSGASYLLERLALTGAWSAASARALAAVETQGGAKGTYTTPDFSSFHETVPAEALGAALRLEASRLTAPEITAARLAREQRAARESQARVEGGGPIGRALQNLYSEVFGSHPYSRQVTGDPAARDAITLPALKAYASSHYGPPATAVTVVGRFDADSALAELRRTIGAAARRPMSPKRSPAPVAQSRLQRVDVTAEGRFPILAAAWRLPGARDSARAVFPVLAHLLVQGAGSKLVRELVNQPGAPALRLEGALAPRADATLLYFVAALREGADTSAVGTRVLEAAQEIATGVTPEEVERARREVELDLRIDRQTVRGQAQALGTAWMSSGSWKDADDDLAMLASLDAETVKRVASRLLQPDAFTAVWIVPQPARRGGGR